MRALRQGATGLVYGFVLLILVIGSLALAIAQSEGPQRAIATVSAPSSATSISNAAPEPTATRAGSTVPAEASQTSAGPSPVARSATPSATRVVATWTSIAKMPCGPPSGWVRAYTVQQGDTLYRIATNHGVTVPALQRANCRTGTLIFPGERLWVPYASPLATELTVIPTFPTPTEPATDTPEPSATATTPDP